MASCAASRRPRRRLASSSEEAASPKMILSPLGVLIVTRAWLRTHPVMVLPCDSSSSSSESLRGSRMMASTWVQSLLVSMTTSSWPRPTSPSLAVSLPGETRMVSSWTRVPRWPWATATTGRQDSVAARTMTRVFMSRLLSERAVLANVSSATELFEHLGFEVSAADDGNVHRCAGQLIAVEQESGNRDSATGFGDGFGVTGQKFRCLENFVFRHRDDVVNVAAHVIEVDGAHALRAQSVRQGAGDLLGGKLHDPSGTQAGLGIGGQFGFDPDDFDLRMTELDRGGNTGDEPSAADGGEDGRDFRYVFDDFESDGALTGNDLFIVVGWNHDVSVAGGEFFGFRLALVGARTDQDDFRSEFGGGFALDEGRVAGHHDDGFHPERAGRIGDALGMIAAGVGDHRALALGCGEGSDFVIRSAEFESADGLLVFGLEKQPGFAPPDSRGRLSPRGRGEFDQAGAEGDSVQAGLGGMEVGQSDHWSRVLSIARRNSAFVFRLAKAVPPVSTPELREGGWGPADASPQSRER